MQLASFFNLRQIQKFFKEKPKKIRDIYQSHMGKTIKKNSQYQVKKV